MDTVVSIGMIINELVTNSMKYAFVKSRYGIVTVSLKELGQMLQLKVEDNGIGLPESFNIQSSQSFGYKMIRAFVQKLKAVISINREHGTSVCIEFNKR
ncbi:MAG: sensor histidine kinase [Saprospiraceae bacterium]|nr:sensor histidine kinase [Saprospiraceae bacterium]